MRTWVRRLAAAVLAASPLGLGLLPADAHAAGLVLITNIQDGGMSQVSPMADQTLVSHQCVNSSSGRYRVTVTGSGSGGALELSAGAGLTLPYQVAWSDSGTATSGQALTSGLPLTGMTTPFLTSCLLGSISSTVVVRFATGDLQTAVAGLTYGGVLTLLVAPE